MRRIPKHAIGLLAFVLAASAASGFGAPARKAAAQAPVPEEILQAKLIFISNMGEACNPYSGGPNRAYTEFYNAMKKWGRFKLTSRPDRGDLDFEIGLKCSGVLDYFGEELSGGLSYSPYYNIRLQLVIRDIKTRMPLWVINEPIEKAFFQGSSDKHFDQAVDQLTTDVAALVSAAPPSALPHP